MGACEGVFPLDVLLHLPEALNFFSKISILKETSSQSQLKPPGVYPDIACRVITHPRGAPGCTFLWWAVTSPRVLTSTPGGERNARLKSQIELNQGTRFLWGG